MIGDDGCDPPEQLGTSSAATCRGLRLRRPVRRVPSEVLFADVNRDRSPTWPSGGCRANHPPRPRRWSRIARQIGHAARAGAAVFTVDDQGPDDSSFEGLATRPSPASRRPVTWARVADGTDRHTATCARVPRGSAATLLRPRLVPGRPTKAAGCRRGRGPSGRRPWVRLGLPSGWACGLRVVLGEALVSCAGRGRGQLGSHRDHRPRCAARS